MPMEDFEILGDLGKGSFGSVVKCMRKSDKQFYAMKQIKLQKLKEKDKINALNEIRFLASIHSPYIVDYKEAFYDTSSEKLCVVMEFANGGDLQTKIKKAISNQTRISESQIWSVAYYCLEGLLKLHESNIIHRDVKPANIFFHNQIAKLGDLNVAKHLKDPFTVTQTGTPYYASPEVWNEQPYNYKSDIWSLGCVLYEMAALKPPFRADTPDKLYKKIVSGDYQKISTPYSKQLSLFINGLMTYSQKKRPQTKELLYHPKMLEMRNQMDEQQVQCKDLLETIMFPKNLGSLNSQLPKPKYNMKKTKSTKTIKFAHEEQGKNTKLNSNEQKKMPIKSMKSILGIHLTSQKSIGIVPSSLSSKNLALKELISARRPKALNKVVSQKSIL